MTSAEGSFLGLAKQSAYGTPNTTDASFDYFLFEDGAFGPNNVFLPLPFEIGGGALQRSVIKAGVSSGGAANFIPRPDTLGWLIYGLTGAVTFTADTPVVGFNQHVFELATDQFSAPYYTARYAPGNLWGEQYQDCRVNMLSLNFAGANFLRGSFGVVGGLPAKVSTAAWGAAALVDKGPQFIAPVSDIELPLATNVSVLAGSFVAVSAIPLDEQYVVGKYVPENLDIVNRSFIVNLAIKITDAALYSKMMYDPASGNAWLAAMFREANLKLEFNSDLANYKLSIAANGQSGDNANVYWTATPLGLRSQRQLVMQATGLFTASPTAADPINITLINKAASYAA